MTRRTGRREAPTPADEAGAEWMAAERQTVPRSGRGPASRETLAAGCTAGKHPADRMEESH